DSGKLALRNFDVGGNDLVHGNPFFAGVPGEHDPCPAARRKTGKFNRKLTCRGHNLRMHAIAQTDPIAAFNERAKARGWTLSCMPAQGFERRELKSAL